MSRPPAVFDALGITRPSRRLLSYEVACALLTGPFFPITVLPGLFKYKTLRYSFDEEGVSMSWGLLFRKEINLTYRRIQDIHLTRGLLERRMGLATVAIQTASGSATPEMSIVGVLDAEAMRDFLYGRMRGARGLDGKDTPDAQVPGDGAENEALALLREIRDLLRARPAGGGDGP